MASLESESFSGLGVQLYVQLEGDSVPKSLSGMLVAERVPYFRKA